MKNITIIGSGVIGVCTAYYLNKKGHSVTVVDRKTMNDFENCSYGNAGMIVPSHFIPLAAPGVITKGLKWMLDASSPFYIKPRVNRDLLSWIWQFYRHSTPNHVKESSEILHQLNQLSKELYAEIHSTGIFDFDYRSSGLLMLYKSLACEREEVEMAKKASDLGIEVDVLSQNQVADMQGVEMDVRGGILFPGDAQLNPVDFMIKLQTYLRTQGVKFMYETDIQEIRIAENKVTELLTNKGEVFDVDELVMATGAWSGEMAKKLNLKLPMQGGKGYSFNVDNPEQSIKVQSILCEAKVAVTPFKESIRFAGTMEINGLSLGQNKRRIQAIEKSIPNYLPSFNMKQVDLSDTWAGLRPCSPDGLPYIGKAKQDNVWIASGHAMMGMSMGPISGKLMSQLIDQEKTLLAVDQLSPLRYA